MEKTNRESQRVTRDSLLESTICVDGFNFLDVYNFVGRTHRYTCKGINFVLRLK